MRKITWVGISLCLSLIGCKSSVEKQGDKHLKQANPFLALQRYSLVQKKGNGSPELESSITKAYIGALELSTMNNSESGKLLDYRDRIVALLEKTKNAEDQKLYADAAAKVGKMLIESPEFSSLEVGFKLLNDAQSTPGIDPTILEGVKTARNQFIAARVAKAQKSLDLRLSGNPEEGNGIIADYILSETELLTGKDPAIDALWPKVREANLATFLIYDQEDLGLNPLPVINRFGVVLGITSFNRSGDKTSLQMQAYNGSSNHVSFPGTTFTLVSKSGKEYKAVQVAAAFAKKDLLMAGAVSGIGLVAFAIPSDEAPDFIRFEYATGQSIKWLP